MRYEIGQANRLGNRSNNQDRFLAVEGHDGVLLSLADGMGGVAFGEVAAEILIEQARAAYQRMEQPIAEPEAFLQAILLNSHRAIVAFGKRQHGSVIPGTTAVLCLVQQGQAVWAHVGDSRLYVYQQGVPLYRTTDHSYVEKLFQQGRISRHEQERHPRRNQVTECLGVRLEEPRISISRSVKLQAGDIVLLCSDGLWSPLDDTVMGQMLQGPGDLEQKLDKLAERAERLSYPRSDNISALAMRLLPGRLQGKHDRSEQAGQTGDARLHSAIAQIEQVFHEYEQEIDS